jgi:FAD/FMN-containing dehydrogenase
VQQQAVTLHKARLPQTDQALLPYGLGRSYGDSCLNAEGIVLATRELNNFISFDVEAGILRCQAGVSLAEIIQFCLPKGWFLSVTPGTKFVTVGGAIANDVHGKNHHVDGSFGHHVKQFELLRSDGQSLLCSEETNTDLFHATIGGLGLTGLISWAEIQLKPVNSVNMAVETIRFSNLQEFKLLSSESAKTHMYTVAWVDCLAKGASLGRGIFIRANHANDGILSSSSEIYKQSLQKIVMPFDLPSRSINTWTLHCFNALYYRKQLKKHVCTGQHFDAYFYPLDAIAKWNRMYGKKGFFQYQFVVPADDYQVISLVFKLIADSGLGSFLAVLKEFGEIKSLGLLSFPRKGICLALDFPNRGKQTLDLFDKLDAIVVEANGAVYPAKDARMAKASFLSYFPRAEEFRAYTDPQFSSNFWQRMQL